MFKDNLKHWISFLSNTCFIRDIIRGDIRTGVFRLGGFVLGGYCPGNLVLGGYFLGGYCPCLSMPASTES